MQTQTEPKPTETPALNKGKRDKKQGLALWVMNDVLEDDKIKDESNQQDSDNDGEQNQSESEWRSGLWHF